MLDCAITSRYVHVSRSGGNVRGAWAMAVQRSKTPTTPEPEERQLSLQKTTATDYKSKRHSSASSLPELPSSIELSPPPGGETPLPPRATQKVERMNPRQIIQECVLWKINYTLVNTERGTGNERPGKSSLSLALQINHCVDPRDRQLSIPVSLRLTQLGHRH